MKALILSVLLVFALPASFAQSLLTKSAFVSFYSELGEVLANNFSGTSLLDTSNGKLLFSLPIQSFVFDNATMQQHFNEPDVMNSKAFPRAKFVGTITNHASLNYTKDGEYKVTVKGDLTIRGTTKPVETKGLIKIEKGKIYASAGFTINRLDYGITGKDGAISEELKLEVKATYE